MKIENNCDCYYPNGHGPCEMCGVCPDCECVGGECDYCADD